MKKIVRAISAFCCIALLTGVFSAASTVSAATENFGFYKCERITFTTVQIVGYDGLGGSVTVPSTLYDTKIIRLGDNAFMNCDNITSITLPRVDMFGKNAFNFCSNLEEIVLTEPDALKSIGDYAFGNCVSLTAFDIPEEVNSIGAGAFYRCEKIKEITIPDSITEIGKDTFAYCSNLTEIVIPKNVETIGANAFQNCDKLKTVYLYNDKINIHKSAFTFAPVETLVLLEEADIISSSLLDAMPETLKNIVVSDDFMNIEPDAMEQCRELEFTVGCTNSNLKTYFDFYKIKYNIGHRGTDACEECGVDLRRELQVIERPDTNTDLKQELAKPKAVIKAKKKKITVKYKKVTDATGFQVRYKIKGKKKWTVKTYNSQKTVIKTIKKLKSGKRYKVQVRAMIKQGNNKVYSVWTKAKTVKVK